MDYEPIHPDEQQETTELYNRILIVFKTQGAHINCGIYACLDVIMTCMINSTDGDVVAAANEIEDKLIPTLKHMKDRMLKGEVTVKHAHITEIQATVNQLDAGANPILANMDIAGKKAN